MSDDPTGPPPADGLPVVVELSPPPDAEAAFLRLLKLPHVLFFDSSMPGGRLGRYSFLVADPFEFILSPALMSEPGSSGSAQGNPAEDCLTTLGQRLAAFNSSTLAELPPFQGGAAGLFSYDLGRRLERLPLPAWDEFAAPELAIGLYDVVLAFDHQQRRAWLISQGFPETDPSRRYRQAIQRLREFQQHLAGPPADPARRPQPVQPPLAAHELAPQYAVPRMAGLTSNFSPTRYLETVQAAIDYIYAGDIFQVNLAQRLLHPATDDAVELYLRLRRRNRAPFSAFFDLGEMQIASASPERFVQVRGRRVEARPIKGTRPRSRQPEADLFAGDELAASEKDRAENVMIVDLLRNDLSRVCRPDSVYTTQLCQLEQYEYVLHLVSAIEGELAPDCSAIDLLRATFPGGSITGAPKVRAMEIIAELEPTARGPYCGSLGYLGFDGALDTSILIRTITCGRGWWQMPVGGGIVAQSDPRREYEETWHKAEGLLRALR